MKLNVALSQIQVDAFLECIDLIRNGYHEIGSVDYGEVTATKLRHRENGNVMIVVVTPTSYDFYKNSTWVKGVKGDDDGRRYVVSLNSRGEVKVERLWGGVS